MIDKVNLKGTNHYIEDNDNDGLRGTGVKVKRAYNWHGSNILCFYTDRSNIPNGFNTFGSMRLQPNYYESIRFSGGASSLSTPSDWFYNVNASGWRLEGDGVDSDGYIEVTSSPGTIVGEFTCEVTKDCYLSFYPFWWFNSQFGPGHWGHNEFVHPEWGITLNGASWNLYFSGISKAGYQTINDTSLHFTYVSGPGTFGEYGPDTQATHFKIAQGTTFQTNHSISTIKPNQIISGLQYFEVPNPVNLIGD